MPGSKYVDHSGEQVFCQPYLAEGMRYYGFALDADTGSLQRNVCDRLLNEPSRGRTKFRPAASKVLLVFVETQALRSTVSPYRDYGSFAEQEAAFWVLTVDEVRERLYWTCPYIWVDSAFALTAGREVYGFPKALGWFQIPTDPTRAELFTADTVVLKEYSARAQGTRERLVEVRRMSASAEKPPGSSWQTLVQATKALLELLEGEDSLLKEARLAFDTAEDLLHATAPVVFLKQFRDAANGECACYQSIVELPTKIVHFRHGGHLPGEYEVIVNRFESHPIHADLGLNEGSLRPRLSFWAEFDLEIGVGREIWRA